MAGFHIVTLGEFGTSGATFNNGHDSVLVWAEDVAQAKSLASAALGSDPSNEAWQNADVYSLSSVGGNELNGWVFTINLTDNQSPFTLISVSVTGAAGQNIDNIGTALAAALNATVINGAAYVGASNILTIVETTDSMGDWHIDMMANPPSIIPIPSSSLYRFRDPSTRITGMFGAITAPGASGIARTVTLVDVKPALYMICKMEPLTFSDFD